jgi:DNA-binding MarR family transcriptional regulator
MKTPHTAVNETSFEFDSFDLREFFPYLVRVYYRAVSDAVSNVYASHYGLSVSEWRTMAVLGPINALSASEIVEQSSMDKVTVSRAIKGLQAHGFLKRDVDSTDKRRAVLKLTQAGIDAFSELVPLVKQIEKDCLQGLTPEEQKTLISLMHRVRQNAENLAQDSLENKRFVSNG